MPGGWSRTATSTASARSGRQILLEPIEWTDDGWPVAAAGRHRRRRSRHQRMPRRSARRRASDDDFASAPPRRAMDLPRADRRARRIDSASDDGLVLSAKGSGPADTSPLCVLTGDHSYEVEVDVESPRVGFDRGRPAPLLQQPAVLRHGDRRRADAELLGRHPHALARAGRARPSDALRIRNDAHIVTGWYRLPGSRVGAARRAVRDIRLPREHDGRPPEPPPGALRRRRRRGAVPGLPVPADRMTRAGDDHVRLGDPTADLSRASASASVSYIAITSSPTAGGSPTASSRRR